MNLRPISTSHRGRLAALLAVALSLALSAGKLEAQLSPGMQLSTGAVDDGAGPDWRTASDAVAWLHLDRPWLSATAAGAVAGQGRSPWAFGGILDATLFAPSWHGLRPSLSLAAARQEAPGYGTALESQSVVRLAYAHDGWGLWAGGGWGAARLGGAPWDDATASAAPLLPAGWSSEVGAWRQLGGALIRVGLTTRARSLSARAGSPRSVAIGPLHYDPRSGSYVVDTVVQPTLDRWSEAEAGVYWSRGRWSLDAAFGAPVTGSETGGAWTRLDASMMLGERLAVVMGAGLAPARLAFLAPDRRQFTMGLRWTRAPLRNSALPAIEPAAAAFQVHRADARHARIQVRVPGARTVELSGDFTAWRPVSLRHDALDSWSVTLPIEPGTYHVSLRVNGGEWNAPPGLPQVRDEFSGIVGLVVVR